MNYKIVNGSLDSNNRSVASVQEVKTDIMVASNIPMIEAMDLCRTLNRGYGFNGWTPEFFMNAFPLAKENNF